MISTENCDMYSECPVFSSWMMVEIAAGYVITGVCLVGIGIDREIKTHNEEMKRQLNPH